jgi:hypothetical protein
MEKQIKKLARQLRDDGVAPERDLWPGIEKAIGQKKPKRRFDSNAWLRLGAMAATVVLLIGSGYFGGGLPESDLKTGTGKMAHNSVKVTEREPSLLQNLNQTISDLDVAMAMDPENFKLSRLSLMAHKSRANLMRIGTRR